MPVGQFDKPEPNKVIAALQRLGNQRPTGINLRVPRMSQDYLGTYLGPEAVDANLSLVRLHGGATIRFVPKLSGLTLNAGDIVKLQESSAIKLHIVGKIVGNITLAANAASNVAKPGAPTSYAGGAVTSTTKAVTWVAGTDSFGSGLTYQIYVNGVFKTATVSGATSATITGLSAGTTYSSFVVAIDGAGNQSMNSNTINFTTSGVVIPPAGTTVTKKYKATSLRSYNYNGDNEVDSWHNGSCYQGVSSGSNQLGLIFFDTAAIQNDLGGNQILSAFVTITFAHWYNSSGGTATVGTHNYFTIPSVVSSSRMSEDWNRVSHAGVAFTQDIGIDYGEDFRDGNLAGIKIGKGIDGRRTYYGYTYGIGTHVPYLTFTYRV